MSIKMGNRGIDINDIFVIPIDDKFLLYAPLHRFVAQANSAALGRLKKRLSIANVKADDNLPSLIKTLFRSNPDHFGETDVNIYDGISCVSHTTKPQATNPTSFFSPTRVTFLPTHQCNLNCIYCYSSAGQQSTFLSKEVGRAAVSAIVQNAESTYRKCIQIGFHGGGEPTLAWDFVTSSIQYAKELTTKYHLELTTSLITNGILNDKQRLWIVDNISSLTVSLDGLELEHNRHRPLKTGRGSYDIVQKTLDVFDASNIKYFIQATVTQFNVDTMPEFVMGIAKRKGLFGVKFEPVTVTGRCSSNKIQPPSENIFIRKYREAKAVGDGYGIEIHHSGATIGHSTKNSYCGVAEPNFMVTPDAYVTSCLQVTTTTHPFADVFIYGRYIKNKKCFEFNQRKIQRLRGFTVNRRKACNGCFLKWDCAGGCPLHLLKKGHDYENAPISNKCHICWKLSKDQLQSLISD